MPGKVPAHSCQRSLPLRVTGRLKLALDLMVWGGSDGMALEWDEAAKHAGLRTRTMRLAIQKPHVRAHLNEQRRTLLACSSAQTLQQGAKNRVTFFLAYFFVRRRIFS